MHARSCVLFSYGDNPNTAPPVRRRRTASEFQLRRSSAKSEPVLYVTYEDEFKHGGRSLWFHQGAPFDREIPLHQSHLDSGRTHFFKAPAFRKGFAFESVAGETRHCEGIKVELFGLNVSTANHQECSKSTDTHTH